MSDEGDEIQEFINAEGELENYSKEEEPWQIQILHELLSLQRVEEYTPAEFQHILALNAALKKSMQGFYETYASTFQGIHDQSLMWSSASPVRTKPFSREFYLSMPTPFEELVLSIDTQVREMQASNRFPEYDFERHMGNLNIIQDPSFQQPMSDEAQQMLAEIGQAQDIRHDRYNERWDASLTNNHPHDLSRFIQPQTRPIQRSSSSAEDEAEQSRKRMIQASGGGQTLPQTPIRGTPPMLGNTFTSMSSPGGMGNLSYGGGSSTIPQTNPYTL